MSVSRHERGGASQTRRMLQVVVSYCGDSGSISYKSHLIFPISFHGTLAHPFLDAQFLHTSLTSTSPLIPSSLTCAVSLKISLIYHETVKTNPISWFCVCAGSLTLGANISPRSGGIVEIVQTNEISMCWFLAQNALLSYPFPYPSYVNPESRSVKTP